MSVRCAASSSGAARTSSTSASAWCRSEQRSGTTLKSIAERRTQNSGALVPRLGVELGIHAPSALGTERVAHPEVRRLFQILPEGLPVGFRRSHALAVRADRQQVAQRAD